VSATIPPVGAIAAEHGASAWRLRVKGTLAGRLVAVPFRWRRAPAQALRAARAQGNGEARPPASRRAVAFVIMAGQGEGAGLQDTLASITRWHGIDAGIVVLDDATTDCTRAAVHAQRPDAVVLRNRWPHNMPPYQYPGIARLLDAALAHFDPDVVIKLDTDALLTGPGLPTRAAGAFAATPGDGLLGTVQRSTYDLWVLDRERRTSPTVRRLHDAALKGGYDGGKAHGGVYVLSREALRRMRDGGWLAWRPPVWTLVNEDACVALAVHACGLRVAAAPAIRSVSHTMPVTLAQADLRDVLAVHSVRRGRDGESEAEVRRFFAAARGVAGG
jgi:hypothetical protein